MSTVKEMDGN